MLCTTSFDKSAGADKELSFACLLSKRPIALLLNIRLLKKNNSAKKDQGATPIPCEVHFFTCFVDLEYDFVSFLVLNYEEIEHVLQNLKSQLCETLLQCSFCSTSLPPVLATPTTIQPLFIDAIIVLYLPCKSLI